MNSATIIDNLTYSRSVKKLNRLIDTLQFCNLSQYNNVFNGGGRRLDLVLSNIHIDVNQSHSLVIHHPPLVLNLDFISQRQNFSSYT